MSSVKSCESLSRSSNLRNSARSKAKSLPLLLMEAVVAIAYHEVDRGASAEDTTHWDNCFTSIKVLRSLRLVEESCFCVWGKMAKIESRVSNCWVLKIVWTAFDEENLEVWICFGKAACGDTCCGSSSGKDDIHLAHVGSVFDCHDCGGKGETWNTKGYSGERSCGCPTLSYLLYSAHIHPSIHPSALTPGKPLYQHRPICANTNVDNGKNLLWELSTPGVVGRAFLGDRDGAIAIEDCAEPVGTAPWPWRVLSFASNPPNQRT